MLNRLQSEEIYLFDYYGSALDSLLYTYVDDFIEIFAQQNEWVELPSNFSIHNYDSSPIHIPSDETISIFNNIVDLLDSDDMSILNDYFEHFEDYITTNISDGDRILLKSSVAVGIYSWQYWNASSYDIFSFLSPDVLDEFYFPQTMVLYDESPRSISWVDITTADMYGVMVKVAEGILEMYLTALITGGASIPAFFIGIGVAAAIASIKAYIVKSADYHLEVMNPEHSIFMDTDGSYYQYLRSKYISNPDRFSSYLGGKYNYLIPTF